MKSKHRACRKTSSASTEATYFAHPEQITFFCLKLSFYG